MQEEVEGEIRFLAKKDLIKVSSRDLAISVGFFLGGGGVGSMTLEVEGGRGWKKGSAPDPNSMTESGCRGRASLLAPFFSSPSSSSTQLFALILLRFGGVGRKRGGGRGLYLSFFSGKVVYVAFLYLSLFCQQSLRVILSY